ncbi:MAG: hypothetical protein ACREPR_02055, partial [Brasilonema sp.]
LNPHRLHGVHSWLGFESRVQLILNSVSGAGRSPFCLLTSSSIFIVPKRNRYATVSVRFSLLIISHILGIL